jgi:HK97 family phage portal protein
MHPDNVVILIKDGEVYYKYQPNNSGETFLLPSADVYHVKGMSGDGLIGYSPLKQAKETFAHAYAAQQYGSRLFGNDTRPGGVLECDAELDDESFDRLKQSWEDSHRGENQHRIAILEGGMKFHQISITPEEAQFIATRHLTRSEICGIFRIPPYMIADLEKANYSNIVMQDLAFSKHTLTPWCERIEQAIEFRVLMEVDRAKGIYVKHNMEGMLRGDIKTRYDSYAVLWDRGVLSANEIRALEDLNPVEHGDNYYIPLNYVGATAETGEIQPLRFLPQRPQLLPAATSEDRCACGQDHTPIDIEQRKKEIRTRKGKALQNVIIAQRAILDEAMKRVVRREKDKILAAAKKNLRSKQGFYNFLDDFAQDTEYTEAQVRGAFEALARLVGIETMRQIDMDFNYNDSLQAWVSSYVRTFAQHHADATRNQIRSLLDNSEGNLYEILEERLDAWTDDEAATSTRSTRVAEHESVRFANAFVMVSAAAVGRTTYTWSTVGENCPICEEMDGRTVGFGEAFVDGPESNLKDGDGNAFKPSGPVLQPPLHGGCDCVIVLE